MAEKNLTSVECSLLSIPCKFIQLRSDFEGLIDNVESVVLGLGSNTLLINEDTAVNLKITTRDALCRVVWAVLKLTFNLSENNCTSTTFTSKRLVQVLIVSSIRDKTVILSEDLLYNLQYSSGLRDLCWTNTIIKPKKLELASESASEHSPSKARKVVLSMIQCETNLEDHFVDKILQMYFSYSRCLCKNDVFSVRVPDYLKSDSINTTNIDIVYFKVCEIEGFQSTNSETTDNGCWSYLVDSSAVMYQVSNFQDLFPPRRLPVGYTNDFSVLLSNEKLLDSVLLRNHSLIPSCFDKTFEVLCKWIKPFICGFKQLKVVELTPVFLLLGQNGSGKSLLMQSLSQYFGINYWRVNSLSVGDSVPGQTEAKLKAIFNRLQNVAPCILHLSNIQALFTDAEGKDDVRVLNCFEQQVKSLKPKGPIIVVGSTGNLKCISASMNQLFLESVTLKAPTQEERENILSWLIDCNGGVIDQQILQAVTVQTSGFVFRDLEVLAMLASKEKYKRKMHEGSNVDDFVFTDFSKIIGIMRKAFSESIGAPKVPSVSWKDVGGLEPLKKEILRSLRSNMFNTGLKRSGLLLHGPPGTGKTLLAKAVATQCGRSFLSVKGPELLNKYVGQSEHNVRDLFELAKAASPCIVFFDELDSLAPNRGRSGDSGGVMDRVVSQLLAEMDDLGNSGDVFILGATNRPDLIDPALLRPGRLDKLLYVGPCEDRNSQLSVLTALTRKLSLAPDVDLENLIISVPVKVSGAQLSALCSAAWLASARESIQSGEYKHNARVAVHQSHFLSALASVFS